jgi:hypothetical protein
MKKSLLSAAVAAALMSGAANADALKLTDQQMDNVSAGLAVAYADAAARADGFFYAEAGTYTVSDASSLFLGLFNSARSSSGSFSLAF